MHKIRLLLLVICVSGGAAAAQITTIASATTVKTDVMEANRRTLLTVLGGAEITEGLQVVDERVV